MDELLQDFLVETGEHVEAVASQLLAFEREPANSEAIANIFRLVHTIKGTCGFLDLPRLEQLAHAAESLIAHVRDAGAASPAAVTLVLTAVDRIKEILVAIERSGGAEPPGSDGSLIALLEAAASGVGALAPQAAISNQPEPAPPPVAVEGAKRAPAGPVVLDSAGIRVSVDALERIMRLVSELVLTRNQLLDVSRGQTDGRFTAPLQRLSSLTSDLQDGVMRARLQPIDRLFTKLPRLVRDLNIELGKKIELVIEGAETELDRQLVEALRDPLTHIIRNCADHGIEEPGERERLGKPATGVIHVRAGHEAGLLVVEVWDDGRGFDIERIRAKALARELAPASELATMSAQDVCSFVFAPGFSTATSITNISGRGIGMDVVRNRIEAVGGSVELSSQPGAGARFSIKLPLTLAIAPALVVECAGQRFALPQQSVTEAVAILQDGVSRLYSAGGALVAQLRGAILPIIDLRAVLGMEPLPDPCQHDGLIVVIRTGRHAYGLLVDSVTDFQEIVVKPLGAALSQLVVYAGNTILGDGSVVLILDPDGVATAFGAEAVEQPHGFEAQAHAESHERTTLLLFRIAQSGALKALPLSLVSRIVTASRNEIAAVDGLLTMRHQGALMPLVALCDPALEPARADWPVLVAGVGGEPVGLMISEIVDVVTETIAIDVAGVGAASIGYGVVRNEAADILDIAHYLEQARPEAFRRGHARKFSVLLVDDKPFFRDMLAPVVMAAGYEVSTASSGAEAIARVLRGRPVDLVVSDIEMPGMDGYTLAKTIRDAGHTMPMIALDAHAGPAIITAAREAGFRTAVGKFDRRRLLSALREAFEGAAFTDAALETRAGLESAA